jgi:fatty-acyl-CoA synthase
MSKLSFEPLTPTSFLARSALVHGDRVGVTDGPLTLSYRELRGRAARLAGAIEGLGVEPGGRVAVLAANSHLMLEAHYGVPLARAVLVALNMRLSAAELGYILNHSGARVLLCDSELEPLARRALAAGGADAELVAAPEYERRLESAPEVWHGVDDERGLLAINYTSGTTGRPKGVMYHHRGAYLQSLAMAFHAQLGPDSVFLWTLPMFHCNGWCFTWAVTAVGGRHVCLRKVDPGRIWELLGSEGVTHFNGAPTVHIGVANDPAARRLDQPVTITVAGAPPSPTLLGQLGELNFRTVHVYGLTETYGPYTVCDRHDDWDDLQGDERARLLARQGQAYVIADPVRVVTEDMADVPRDGATLGEVAMRGNDVMKGYYDQPEATAEAFRGGWFHSGDIAVMHPDGAIELRDRKKDIIISGGENISTIEVEQTVARHPAVLECAVVAIPDEKWGERPKAFVVLKPGASATAEEIIAFCRENLAKFKCPAAVEFTELPKTSTGKIQKFVLRDKEWSGRDKRIN